MRNGLTRMRPLSVTHASQALRPLTAVSATEVPVDAVNGRRSLWSRAAVREKRKEAHVQGRRTLEVGSCPPRQRPRRRSPAHAMPTARGHPASPPTARSFSLVSPGPESEASRTTRPQRSGAPPCCLLSASFYACPPHTSVLACHIRPSSMLVRVSTSRWLAKRRVASASVPSAAAGARQSTRVSSSQTTATSWPVAAMSARTTQASALRSVIGVL